MTPVELVAWTALATLTVVSWMMTALASARWQDARDKVLRLEDKLRDEKRNSETFANDYRIYKTKYETLTEATKRIGVESPKEGK